MNKLLQFLRIVASDPLLRAAANGGEEGRDAAVMSALRSKASKIKMKNVLDSGGKEGGVAPSTQEGALVQQGEASK